METLTSYWWAGPEKHGGPRRAHQHSVRPRNTAQPTAGSRLRAAADERAPQVRETDRGGKKSDDVARRRWQLWRGHQYQLVHLTHAHLGIPSIAAISAARGNGDGHGGARPRVGQLRRGDGIMALMACPTSIGITNWT